MRLANAGSTRKPTVSYQANGQPAWSLIHPRPLVALGLLLEQVARYFHQDLG